MLPFAGSSIAMLFFAGVVQSDGRRHVVAGKAAPALTDMSMVTDDNYAYDWGPEGNSVGVYNLACAIAQFLEVTSLDTAVAVLQKLLRGMETGRPWLLPQERIDAELSRVETIQ